MSDVVWSDEGETLASDSPPRRTLADATRADVLPPKSGIPELNDAFKQMHRQEVSERAIAFPPMRFCRVVYRVGESIPGAPREAMTFLHVAGLFPDRIPLVTACGPAIVQSVKQGGGGDYVQIVLAISETVTWIYEFVGAATVKTKDRVHAGHPIGRVYDSDTTVAVQALDGGKPFDPLRTFHVVSHSDALAVTRAEIDHIVSNDGYFVLGNGRLREQQVGLLRTWWKNAVWSIQSVYSNQPLPADVEFVSAD